MARAKKAVEALPTDAEASAAVEALKQRILGMMAAIPGLPVGSEPWNAALERRINNAIDAQFVLALKAELIELLPRLARGESGPVVKDSVDIA